MSMTPTGVSYRARYSKYSFGTWPRQRATLERFFLYGPVFSFHVRGSCLETSPQTADSQHSHGGSQHFLGALAVQHAVIHTFDLICNGAVVSKLLHILTESD